MYNPEGTPLSASSTLPLDGATFDLIGLFSVFTHLDPTDYRRMLEVLRPHARPDSRLVYSLFLHELTAGGHGLIDGLARTAAEAAADENGADEAALGEPPSRDVADFADIGPNPLQWAVYSRDHALALVEGTGWEVESINDPTPAIQHYIVARPVRSARSRAIS